MSEKGKFPFREGSLLKDAGWQKDVEWRDKEEFDATLTIEKITSTTATWKDAEGCTFPMFLSDLKAVLLYGVGAGTITARWTMVKRGTKYGILLADAPKRARYHQYQVRGVFPKFKYADWVATDVREIDETEFRSIRHAIPNYYENAFKKDFPPPSFNGRSGKEITVERYWETRLEPEYRYYAASWHRKD